MTGYVTYEASLSRVEDLHRHAMRRPAARQDATQPRPARAQAIAVRRATAADRSALEMLAALDGGRMPSGDVLIAEIGDEPQAAIEVATGVTIADPFRKTAQLVELLTLRAAGLRRHADSPRRLRLRSRSAYRTA
jgi:hypothetical protein